MEKKDKFLLIAMRLDNYTEEDKMLPCEKICRCSKCSMPVCITKITIDKMEARGVTIEEADVWCAECAQPHVKSFAAVGHKNVPPTTEELELISKRSVSSIADTTKGLQEIWEVVMNKPLVDYVLDKMRAHTNERTIWVISVREVPGDSGKTFYTTEVTTSLPVPTFFAMMGVYSKLEDAKAVVPPTMTLLMPTDEDRNNGIVAVYL